MFIKAIFLKIVCVEIGSSCLPLKELTDYISRLHLSVSVQKFEFTLLQNEPRNPLCQLRIFAYFIRLSRDSYDRNGFALP